MADIDFRVEVVHDLDELVQRGVRAIVAAVDEMSRALREDHLPDETPVGATGALSSAWNEREQDPLTRVVTPPREAWYAHIVARGSSGPIVPGTGIRALPQPGGLYRASASGQSANPFDDRAMAAVESRADQMMMDALSAEGL